MWNQLLKRKRCWSGSSLLTKQTNKTTLAYNGDLWSHLFLSTQEAMQGTERETGWGIKLCQNFVTGMIKLCQNFVQLGWWVRAPSLIIAPPTMTLFCKSTRREKLEQEPSPLVCLSHNAWLQNRICSEWSGIGAAKKIGFKSFFAKEFLLFNCLKCAVKQFFSNLIYWQHDL